MNNDIIRDAQTHLDQLQNLVSYPLMVFDSRFECFARIRDVYLDSNLCVGGNQITLINGEWVVLDIEIDTSSEVEDDDLVICKKKGVKKLMIRKKMGRSLISVERYPCLVEDRKLFCILGKVTDQLDDDDVWDLDNPECY